ETAYQKLFNSRLKWLVVVLLAAMVLIQVGPFAAPGIFVQAETAMERTGTVTVSAANIRSGPGTSYDKLCTVYLDHAVQVNAVTAGEYVSPYGDQWYRVTLVYSGSTLSGYVVASFITLDPVATTTTAEVTSSETTSVTSLAASETSSSSESSFLESVTAETSILESTSGETSSSETSVTGTTSETTPTTTVDFEELLSAEGFPESYKAGLRELHALYPNWLFKALHTNLDWNVVIENENYPGRSLISTSDGTFGIDGYRSTDEGAYDWATNTWTVYDGSTWVMCNRDVIKYYMDPRNFLSSTMITRFFQFEALNYQPATQTITGIEKILSGSFMGNKSFDYIDAASGEMRTMLYSQAFLKAADYSKVSPYHLASRSRIEVGSNGSSSVSGTFSADLVAAYLKRGEVYTPTSDDTALDGIYNFYNIGAYSSTLLLGNIRNGLIYAKDKSKHLFPIVEFNPTYQENQAATIIPWNNRLRSIVAGSLFIGNSYINVGQNTLYLQKFDVDNSYNGLYWHQYMGSIYAPYVESRSIYNAYVNMGMIGESMTFIIPVFNSMPSTACQLPSTGNPNNWLKSLTVGSYPLTPTFDPANTGPYSLIVDNDVTSVSVTATPVTTKASIAGAGTLQLPVGENTVSLVVTAENGNKRTYNLTIVRKNIEVTPTPTPSPTIAPTASASPTPTGLPTVTVTPVPSATPTAPATVTPSPWPTPTVTPTPAPVLSSTEFSVSESTVTGLNPQNGQNTAANITAGLTAPAGYNVAVVNADGSPCTGLVGTGCSVRLMSGNSIAKEYIVILYGDASGDGKINAIDLATISWHLLKKKHIISNYLQASDVNKDNKTNAIDFAIIGRYLLHAFEINQN
ncbi:MAG TPA: hypothetical protein DCM45_05185, partial [Clostridiales bacterium]|nr:hypothetical protein [Clostridiales bacterium]